MFTNSLTASAGLNHSVWDLPEAACACCAPENLPFAGVDDSTASSRAPRAALVGISVLGKKVLELVSLPEGCSLLQWQVL